MKMYLQKKVSTHRDDLNKYVRGNTYKIANDDQKSQTVNQRAATYAQRSTGGVNCASAAKPSRGTVPPDENVPLGKKLPSTEMT